LNTQEEFESFLDEFQTAVLKEYPLVTMQSAHGIKFGSQEIVFKMFLVKMNDNQKETQIQVIPPQCLCTKKFDTLFYEQEYSYLEASEEPPSAEYTPFELRRIYYFSLISFHPKMDENGYSYIVNIEGMPHKNTVALLNEFEDRLVNVSHTVIGNRVLFKSIDVFIEFVTSDPLKYENQFL